MALAIEDKRREEEELRNETAKLFRKTTDIKQSIPDHYDAIIGKEIPSLEEVEAMMKEARDSFYEHLHK